MNGLAPEISKYSSQNFRGTPGTNGLNFSRCFIRSFIMSLLLAELVFASIERCSSVRGLNSEEHVNPHKI